MIPTGAAAGATNGRHLHCLPGEVAFRSDLHGAGIHRTPRDWWVDILCVLGSLPFALATAVVPILEPQRSPTVVEYLQCGFGTLGCLALWLRRRWPVSTALGLVTMSIVAPVGAVASTLALFAVVVHRRLVVAVWVVAYFFALQVPTELLRTRIIDDEPVPRGDIILVLAAGAVYSAVILGWGSIVGLRRQVLTS